MNLSKVAKHTMVTYIKTEYSKYHGITHAPGLNKHSTN